jgi:hydroxymethylpyrimidine kinase/phosphomethylpyrimidine kinase
MLVALTVAGSDSVGGAGIQADVKAMASQGVHAAVALTAITAQNTRRVAEVYPLPPQVVVNQIDAVLEDVHVSGAKTGMLYSAEIAAAVAYRLDGEDIPLVVDPVLVAGVGDPLSRADLVEALKSKVISLATVVTPNIPEAEALVGFDIRDEGAVRRACREIAGLGAEAVLIKGGHMATEGCVDTLFYNGKFLLVEAPRVDARGHGGGCILSSYLAANLAKGRGIWEAVLESKVAIDESIKARYIIGHGIPVVEPLGRQLRDAQRFQASSRLRAASMELVRRLPEGWIDHGTVMVFALPGAEGPSDVCSVEFKGSGSVMTSGCPTFATTGPAQETILAAMRSDEGMRAAVDLVFDEGHLAALRKAGLTITTEGREGHLFRKASEGMEDAITMLGFVPDIMVDQDVSAERPVIRVFASSPEVLLSKLISVQR